MGSTSSESGGSEGGGEVVVTGEIIKNENAALNLREIIKNFFGI